MFKITLYHYICLAFLIFITGLLGMILSRNIVKILLCTEFMMSAINLNFIAFTVFKDYIFLKGMIFSVYITIISALQSVVCLVLIYIIYKYRKTMTTEEIKE